MTKPIVRKLRCAVYTRKSSEEGLEQEFNWDRQVVGGLRNDNPDAGSQAAFSSRVMSPQIQWASALA